MTHRVLLLVVIVVLFLTTLFFFDAARDVAIENKKLVLGIQDQYEMKSIRAPVLRGALLKIASVILRHVPSLRRKMLNENHLEDVRVLASQVALPPMYFPVYRASSSEWHDAAELAATSHRQLDLNFRNISAAKGNFNTVIDYARAYRANKTNPVDLMKRTLAAVKDFKDRGLNIFASIIEKDVMAQAEASRARFQNGEPRSLFDGVPVAVKDMNDIEGHAMCNGQFVDTCILATKDDPIVSRFREAGAIIFGTTIMTEGGVTPLGYNVHYKGPHSAYGRDRYSGGSSSGSAVAVSSGILPVAIGFDGGNFILEVIVSFIRQFEGGSIRIPSSMSGLHGLGATFGRIPFNNHTSSTMIKAGPMTTCALDTALAYELISPTLRGHFYTKLYNNQDGPPPPHTAGFNDIDNLSDVRLGYYEDWFSHSDPDVVNICKRVLDLLQAKGAVLVPISIPHLQQMQMAHGTKIATEFAQAFDALYHQMRQSGEDILEPNTYITVGVGSSVTAKEILAAEKLRAWSFEYMRGLFARESLSAIVTPTIPILPPELKAEAKTYGENNNPITMQLLRYIFMGNYVGMPGYSVPAGMTSNLPNAPKLPVGIHFMGNHWEEAKLLRLAHAVEAATPATFDRPSFFADVLGDVTCINNP